ncbi:FG-GAP repeat domain-containing protein, partial [Neptunomonas sp.]|uniref:FG-GAP repeat domain-containing protein n=1 Tax=Neptunomonas sp. TaxID=1971898 RepID=UPI003567D3B8
MAIRIFSYRLRVMVLPLCLALVACAPLPREDRGEVAAVDYDIVAAYDDTTRVQRLDLPALPEWAEDCNDNKIDDAYDWAGYIPRGPYSVGNGPIDIAVGNMNTSARLELVVANNIAGTVSVLEQSRDRRFTSGAEHDTGDLPVCLTLADLNADGVQDIVVGHAVSAPSAVTVLTNRGDGADFTRVDHPLSDDPTQNRNPECVGAAALRSGGPDILASSGGAGMGDVNRMMTLFDDSDFTSPEHLHIHWMGAPGKFVIADFDNDGDNDFCSLSNYSNKVTCVKNPTSTSPTTSLADWFFFYFIAGVYGHGLAAADFNGDALPDLAIVGNNGLSVFMNTGNFGGYCSEYSENNDESERYCLSMVFQLFETPLGPFDVGGSSRAVTAADLDG